MERLRPEPEGRLLSEQSMISPEQGTEQQVNPELLRGDDPLDHLLINVEQPWYKSLVQDFREWIHPPKLPPLELTSQPVPVKDIWGFYGGQEKKAGVTSMLIHVAVVTLIFTVSFNPTVQQAAKQAVTLLAPDLGAYKPDMAVKKNAMQGGGGGGNHSPLPAAKGKLPRISDKQFVPPSEVVLNEHPKLPMEPTIIAQPDAKLPQITANNYGDPLSKYGVLSNGTGSGGGIGSGRGGGVGPGSGGGYGPGSGGNTGGGVYRIGGGVSQPVPIYRPDPDYSEEARKAKYQGTVVLAIVVDEKGNPRDVRVVKPLGLGLDEKAIEAVTKWRFRPGMKDGHPVKVMAQIEVNFRLL
jgi:TonB family protein